MSNDTIHLRGIIETDPVLDHLTRPDGGSTVRVVNTLIGPDNDRHTIVFTGQQARAARQALTAGTPIQLTGRFIGPHRIEVDQFTLTNERQSEHSHQLITGAHVGPSHNVEADDPANTKDGRTGDRPTVNTSRHPTLSRSSRAEPISEQRQRPVRNADRSTAAAQVLLDHSSCRKAGVIRPQVTHPESLSCFSHLRTHNPPRADPIA